MDKNYEYFYDYNCEENFTTEVQRVLIKDVVDSVCDKQYSNDDKKNNGCKYGFLRYDEGYDICNSFPELTSKYNQEEQKKIIEGCNWGIQNGLTNIEIKGLIANLK